MAYFSFVGEIRYLFLCVFTHNMSSMKDVLPANYFVFHFFFLGFFFKNFFLVNLHILYITLVKKINRVFENIILIIFQNIFT